MEIKSQYNPVKLIFGKGVLNTLAAEIQKYGHRCLLLIQDNNDAMILIREKIIGILDKGNIKYDIFSEIRPNPLITDIDKGIQLVRNNKYDAIVAVGGGSVIDTAKILRISEKYEIDWKESFKDTNLDLVNQKIPLISIPTTSGTGSHCTQAAVVSDETNQKHTIYSYDFFSTVALVDYTLTMSLPKMLTASTGFDAFCHLSESYIVGKLTPMLEAMNKEAMTNIICTLPKLMIENKEEYREIMSMADSCAGISLSNGGAIIPHAFGEAISSNVYRINHGCSLAICYPAFIREYYNHPKYGKRIKDVIEIINYEHHLIENENDAADVMINFITSIGLKYRLVDYDITNKELENIIQDLLNQTRFDKNDVKNIIDEICKK